MSEVMAPKPKRKQVQTGGRYKESPPDVTSTGIGKNYPGCRIFHWKSDGKTELIDQDYSKRDPNPDELARFRRDLTAAAISMPEVEQYLAQYPELRAPPASSNAVGSAEPMVEGPLSGAKG